ncbi:hypothetical protein B9Z55_026984 [Caenorhabditis nigoni]|uniref:BTB domain-containing protein n=1 Tax=Caenorhabditis nigoni TaxID=1611254 RepID=A0A2G5SIB1_9PELO|nr:hypothetical protein B9Z55_026984 [Caenorhabditis nigoni]
MSETTVPSVYETTFSKTYKTDAILVVDGKKLHVNKAILSYHSDYFNTLFNSNFMEKSMTKIEIKDAEFKDFATLLSLVHEKPIMATLRNGERILELSDRFLMPSVRNVVEFFLISTSNKCGGDHRIGREYRRKRLMRKHENYNNYVFNMLFKKDKPDSNDIEATFAKTDKTDAILVVEGKKLHVNKTILSYHSDYFNTLFNSDFKEKSMSEIEIKDVNYADFAAFLSLITDKPIEPLHKNFKNILDLSDRFLMPTVKFTIENYLASSDEMGYPETFKIADEYYVENLMDHHMSYARPDETGTREENIDARRRFHEQWVEVLNYEYNF